MHRSEVLTVGDLDLDSLPSGTATILRVLHVQSGEVRLATIDERGLVRSLGEHRKAFPRRDWDVQEVVC